MSKTPDPVEAAERDFKILTDMVEAVFRIDCGDFPISAYSSGETKKVRKYDKEHKVWVQGDEPVFITIFKDPKSPEKGLRDLACRTIFNRGEGLARQGHKDIVGKIEAVGNVRDMGTYIGNRRNK